MSFRAKAYLAVIISGGAAVAAWELVHWRPEHLIQIAAFAVIMILGAVMKIHLPGINGTMSVHFLFLLVGISRLDSAAALLAGVSGVIVQCFWKTRTRPKLIQVAFNAANTALAIRFAWLVYHAPIWGHPDLGSAFQVAAMAATFFVFNTGPIALVISLTENKPVARIWTECYFWCFPYYMLGATLAGFFNYVSDRLGWQTALLSFPAIYVTYVAYRLYLGKLESEKKHAEQVAALHLRTIEALALAIDAKDHATHQHLQRVQVYAVEIGKEMKLGATELEALIAASLLHDIGKLAVPEHIVAKPSKLTAEEFEKIKIHPLVGAEILERVQFPYPVAEVVLAHHEKWDGTGYPYGLRGHQIPLGARILSAVDCLDALASDRPYRRAMPIEEAIRVIDSESGKSYDPAVVSILKRRSAELESMAQNHASKRAAVWSRSLKVDRGRPDAGLDGAGGNPPHAPAAEFLVSIAAARQEAQTLFELAQSLGSSLSLQDTLSMLSSRLPKLVSFDSMAVFVIYGDRLRPEFVSGDAATALASLDIPVGQGLSGWVAANRKPVVNGSPDSEAAACRVPGGMAGLSSALSVPLETAESVLGVMTLYSSRADAFSRDQLRVVQAITSKVSSAVENAMRFQVAESSATTDFLTGLANARSLFLYLEGEVNRCRRSKLGLAVIVSDLDGFKQVNDRLGHMKGNEVLSEVAASLRGCARNYDCVARMGGDEFVIVLANVDEAAALARVPGFEAVTVETGLRVCGEEMVSLSTGLAMYPGDGASPEELLAAADRRMYRNKQERKRVRGALQRS
jgi:diguanylate cyclase (GGDEF)-like protein/putative nucleotidyltransferase with HDIG domain